MCTNHNHIIIIIIIIQVFKWKYSPIKNTGTDSWGVNKLKDWCENYEMEKNKNKKMLTTYQFICRMD